MLTVDDIKRVQKIDRMYGNARSGQGRTRGKAGPIPEEYRIIPHVKAAVAPDKSAFRSVPAMRVFKK